MFKTYQRMRKIDSGTAHMEQLYFHRILSYFVRIHADKNVWKGIHQNNNSNLVECKLLCIFKNK